MRLRALALLCLLLACGKQQVHAHEQTSWEPATPANGFHPVMAPACTKVDAAGKIQNTFAGSLQDVSQDEPADRVAHVAADDHYVYWATGSRIERAERATSPWPRAWKSEVVAEPGNTILDLAVTKGRVYWVVDTGGRKAISFLDKQTRTIGTIDDYFITPSISKLVTRGASFFWGSRDGVTEIEDGGATWRTAATPHSATNPVFAVTDTDIYSFSRSDFFTTQSRRPWRMANLTLVSANDPVDAVTDSAFLYWLERGPETPPDEDCDKCSTGGYQIKGQPQHAQGRLRRVPLAGGPSSDLYVGLPNVESLTLVKGILWISTKQGLLRYDPTCHLPPARIAPTAGLHGRAAPFGEALAVLAETPKPRVALLASP